MGGMGLNDNRDSLGGELAWGVGLSVFTPLWPGKAHWPVRTHTFLNVGKVIGYDRGRSLVCRYRVGLSLTLIQKGR